MINLIIPLFSMDQGNIQSKPFSLIGDFYSRNPAFNAGDCPLLDHRPAQRWFGLLKYGADNDVYNFQEVLQGKSGPEVQIRDERVYMMSSYDYLGLIGHREIEAAAVAAIHEYGTGTGGVRLLTGTNELHCRLEKTLARFTGFGSAMVLSSGYMANLAAIAGLFGKNDLVITDENIHRSIEEAIRVAGIPCERFRHNDTASLKELLEKYRSHKRKLVIVEGVYSMDGDICPLPEIVTLKEEYDAFLLVDEAHSLGVLGRSGRGVAEHFGMPADKIDILTGSLSKAIPTNGGFIAAKEEVIIYLKHGGAPYMFSAALSPANTAAAMASLEIIDKENWRLKKLRDNTAQMKEGLRRLGIDTGDSESPVIPVICGSIERASKLSRDCLGNGFLANSVIFPAVPYNRSRLRLCCTAAHSPETIDRFLSVLGKLFKELDTTFIPSILNRERAG